MVRPASFSLVSGKRVIYFPLSPPSRRTYARVNSKLTLSLSLTDVDTQTHFPFFPHMPAFLGKSQLRCQIKNKVLVCLILNRIIFSSKNKISKIGHKMFFESSLDIFTTQCLIRNHRNQHSLRNAICCLATFGKYGLIFRTSRQREQIETSFTFGLNF